ncbi:MAG: small subunit ribosomal protein [Gaiellales bacterium]|nr:small subunit ribosomal protein [Gaiellales bacterium]
MQREAQPRKAASCYRHVLVANIKQQKKRIKVASRQRLENLRYKTTIKTYFRRLETAIDAGDTALIDGEHKLLQVLVDRAAARRALHPNTAARKKSKAARMIAAGPRETVKPKRARKAATGAARNTARSGAKKK